MTTIYSARIESEFSNGVETQCKERDCKLKLTDFPAAKVILNVDNVIPQPPEYPAKRCDRVIVVDESSNVFFIPVEFKSNGSKPSHVKEQLEGGTRFFQDYFPNECKFYPVLVSKSISPRERKKMQNVRVNSKYGNKRIRHVKCNNSLFWKNVKNA